MQQGRPAALKQLLAFRIVELTADTEATQSELSRLGAMGFGVASSYTKEGKTFLVLACTTGVEVVGGGLVG
jgi:hypothetical protein